MDLEEILIIRKQLEDDIANLIQVFSEKTGIANHKINIQRDIIFMNGVFDELIVPKTIVTIQI